MSYDVFKRKICIYAKRAGIDYMRIRFGNDTDNGRYVAYVPGEQLQFTCSKSGLSISVRFHSHVYQIPVDGLKA